MAIVIVTDWRWQRIPNQVTYPTMLIGLILGGLEGLSGIGVGDPFGQGFLAHLTGLVGAFILTFPLYAFRLGMKAGDVKMLMALGALRGPVYLFYAALYGSLAGGVLALALIAARRAVPADPDQRTPLGPLTDRFPPGVRNALRSWIPYGVALGVGALIALWERP